MTDPSAPATGGEPEPVPGARPSDADLSRGTLAGLQWSTLARVFSVVMQVVYTMVMSRLLDPVAFGLMAIGLIVVNLAGYFARLGLAEAVVQRENVTEEEIRASFTGNIVLGVLASGGVFLLAGPIADLVSQPDVRPVIQALSPTFLFMTGGMTSDALLRREMRFGVRAAAEVAAFAIGYLGLGIVLGLMGAGVYSLVVATTSSYLVGSLINYALVRHPVRPVFDVEVYRPLFSYGSRLSLLSLMTYAGNNIDTLTVGRYASAGPLGQYNRAFYLASLPMQYLLLALAQVLFPSFSAIQGQRERLRGAYVEISTLAAVLILPLLGGLAAAAPDAVEVVLGPGWEQAASLVPLFAVAAGFKLMSQLASTLGEATGEVNALLQRQGASLLVLAALLAVAAGGSLQGYALALAAAEVFRHVLFARLAHRFVGTTLRDIARIWSPAVITISAVTVPIALVRWSVTSIDVPLVARFAIEVLTGAVVLPVALRTPPLARVRADLYARLDAAGVGAGRAREVVTLAVGRPPSGG